MQKSTFLLPSRTFWLRSVLEVVLLTLFILLVFHVTVQNFHIEGQSMEPTLHNQEFILVDKISYLLQAPQRGDVIVFQYPKNPQDKYVKRIIAVPGDVISVVGSQVTLNGTRLQESYIRPENDGNPFPAMRNHIVSPDEYFVMGDNRGNSSDSREWGLVPRHNIVGKVDLIYWPFDVDNFGWLPDVSRSFAAPNP
jgi:signal peptidase I